MAIDPEPGRESATVEELIDALKRELLDLFDYTDVQGNRTLVRADVVRALDGARERWRSEGESAWRLPEVRYRGVSAVLERLSRPTRFLKPSFYRDALNRASLAGRSLEVDGFGMDPAFVERFGRLVDFLYKRYWRVEARGVDGIPHRGGALLVANHSGTLPFDALMISAAVRQEHPAHRDARYLIEDLFMTVPFVAPALARLGLVRASRANATRLLRNNEVVGVFPEGDKGISKYYRERYQLQRFGRGGFVRLALENGVPIIPVAVVGAEEIMPMIGKLQMLPKLVGLPYFPVTPLWPHFGLLGFVPLPTKWYIRFGRPLDLSKYGPDCAKDEIVVNQIKEEVRAVIQEMIYELLKERKSVWTG